MAGLSVVPSAPPAEEKPTIKVIQAPQGQAPTVPQTQTAWKDDSPVRLTQQRRSVDLTGRMSAHRVSISQSPVDGSKQRSSKPRKSVVRHGIKRTSWYHTATACRLRAILHGKVWGFVMTILLLVALFLPDLWVVTGGSTNLTIDIMLLIVMISFFVELILLSAVDVTYFLSFFFWMDIVGTVTMIFDITFMLGLDNSVPKDYSADGDSTGGGTVMLLRATRAARVGARAGRLSRVLRMLRFLPFLRNTQPQDDEQGGIAGAISGQLANLLATRVALLTILLVIVIPLFDVLTFPQSDHSLRTWAERLQRLHDDPTRDPASRDAYVHSALIEMRDFFDKHSYGPYKACAGYPGSDEKGWVCTRTYEGWSPKVSAPERMASAWEVTTSNFMVAFNMHKPTQTESIFAIITILFIMFLMIFSGLVLSSVVTELAVRPLERMLGTVKHIAQTVFKFAAEKEEDQEDEDEAYDIDSSSEMKLLEKVVQKLAIIADLQSTHEIEATDDMDEEDIGVLSMMKGQNVVEEKKKQDRRSVMPGAQGRRKAFNPTAVKYEDFGMTQEIYNSWNYNTLAMSKPQKINLAMFTISRFHDVGDGYVTTEAEVATLQRFINAVEKEYPPNPFHNLSHAVDVSHSVARMMRITHSESFLVELEQFSLLVAAVAHDLGHPGVNNGFLSEVGHELALQYNDKSPLENMHCAKLYSLANVKECNIFENLTKEQYKEVRKFCIETILHTDMMGHNTMVKELQLVYQMNSDIFAQCAADGGGSNMAIIEIFTQAENKILSMNNILHSADVSNPCRTWDCCQPWAMMVLEEFFAQGDQEKMLGVPVQFLNDRDKLNRPNSQIGFLEFMIVPFFAAQIRLWPQLGELGTNLQTNIVKWQDLWVQESSPAEEEQAKTQNRVTKVIETLEAAKLGTRP